ncbi:hypothetical protein [Siphonobacter sp. SORGH_AS_1065]|uniref:hypothetical protein n=1 Tax=Siphonobacter sp. SORGH_AS_1065 TaxID=3041795 RepID=UPI002788A291|nr:hypothetical protein [Siphonobacter sp. SORGH_AS_1065]MDQ1089001.1 hypothetical protein [Siphonobacter sp. SORGH_AS_1065]
MLHKYKLVGVPEGGVDHLIDGTRVSVNEQMTDAQAEALIAAGLGYFEPIKPPKPLELDGNPIDQPIPDNPVESGLEDSQEVAGQDSPKPGNTPSGRRTKSRKPVTNAN